MANSLRESARLGYGDEVVITPYRSPIEEAKEIVLQQEESADAPAEREAMRFYLRDELRTSVFRSNRLFLSSTGQVYRSRHEARLRLPRCSSKLHDYSHSRIRPS